jgi:hypothetical protein
LRFFCLPNQAIAAAVELFSLKPADVAGKNPAEQVVNKSESFRRTPKPVLQGDR